MMRRAIALAAAAFLMLSIPFANGLAQFSIEPNIATMYDDNISNDYQQIVDKISTLTLTMGYAFGGSQWNAEAFYDGSLNYYQSVTDMTNQFHAARLLLSSFSGEDQADVLNLELTFGQGMYRGNYAFYNHLLLSASARYKRFLTDRVINNLGYVFRSVSFPQMADFSYTEHAFSGGFSFALPTQTTVILQSDLGAKYYSTIVPAEGSGGMKSGGMSFVPDVAQCTGMVRIGQGILEGTGVSLMTKYQWNVRKQSRFLSSNYGAVSDDELFDDHYGYEGLHTSLTLTQMLSESMLLRMTAGIQNRAYSSLAAFDLDGNQLSTQRVDQRSYLSFLFQKEFEIGFSINAAFDLIRNSSNDLFYDYRNKALTLELSLPF